jgi:GT2 family glycosyltransferase
MSADDPVYEDASQSAGTTAYPAVSVIVPLYKQLEATRAMLDSLLHTLRGRNDVEVILIDDASNDGTGEWLSAVSDARVRAFHNEANLGYARSNNRAAAHARGHVLVLANNDLLFEDGWLQPMLDLLLDGSLHAGIVGNVQRRISDGTIDHCGVDISYEGQLDHIRELPSGAAVPSVRSFAVTAACCAIRREEFAALGGFDESYVNGCEDMDLCLRLAQRGLGSYVAPQSVVGHHVSLSRGTRDLQQVRNSQLLFRNWRDPLHRRLCERWLELWRTGRAAPPLEGLSDAAGLCGGVPDAELAELLATSILDRNEFHRARRLGIAGERPARPGTPDPRPLRRSALEGYVHLEDAAEFTLPAGLGLNGLFICGHFYRPRSGRGTAAPLHIVLEVNGVQRVVQPLSGGDFTIGFHRPWVTRGRPSRARLWLEGAEAGYSRVGGDIYLKHWVLDDEAIEPFTNLIA